MWTWKSVLLTLALPLACTACAQESTDTQSTGIIDSSAQDNVQASPAEPPQVTLAELEAAVASVPKLSAFILHQGEGIQYEHYANGGARDKAVNIKSASKSILNALTAIALEQGHIESLDTPIKQYLPQYFADIPAEDPRHQITIRHLLTMSSGLPSTSIANYGAWVSSRDWIGYALRQQPLSSPGTRMVYSTGDTHLLAAVLTKATGMPLRTFAQRHLFNRLGVEIGGWDRDPQGIYFGGNNVALSPAALLTFGRLYLESGTLNGKRILDPEWIAESWTPRFLNSSFNMRHDYGYLWWHTRFAGHSTWFAWGYGGQFLFVIPSLDAVVVLTCDPDTRTRGSNSYIYDLMEHVVVPYLYHAQNDVRAS